MVITQEKYTALMPLIQTLPGFSGTTIHNNNFTLKFSFYSGFACCISSNTKNTTLAVHFENQQNDEVAFLTIMNAING
ncbi:hypothetical protein EGD00_02685 [Pectobacterium carotovorum subsp. carotovorum]|nr:hypothetical protein EGD00_02685 [Pectobacterium carotovorum subsp. carotovorum]